MKEQQKILSFTIEELTKKMGLWFPKQPVFLWNGKVKEGICLYVQNVEQAKSRNMMETIKITRSDKELGEVEILVPVPQMVYLNLSLVPTFKDISKALDFNSSLISHLNDEPFVDLGEMSWYGNENKNTMIEVLEPHELGDLPPELQDFSSYKWNVRVQLGVNSSKEEKVSRVITRQFAAVNK